MKGHNDGTGQPIAPADGWPGYHLLQCDQCGATWAGPHAEPCDYCRRRRDARLQRRNDGQ